MVEYSPLNALWPQSEDIDTWVDTHNNSNDIERMMRIVNTLSKSTLFCADQDRFFVIFTCELFLQNKHIVLASLQSVVKKTIPKFKELLNGEYFEYFEYARRNIDLEYINAAKRRYISKVLSRTVLGSELADKIVEYLWV